MAELTSDELAAMRKRVEAATPGPWRNTIRRESAKDIGAAFANTPANRGTRVSQSVVDCACTPTVNNVLFWTGPAAGVDSDDCCDAEFVANSRSDLPRLLDEVERLKAIIKGLIQAQM